MPPGNTLDSPRKQTFMDILRKFSYCFMKYMLSVLEAIQMSTLNTLLLYRRSKRSLNYIHLPPDLVLSFTLSGSNYPCFEQIYIVSKMFELLRLDFTNKNELQQKNLHGPVSKTSISPFIPMQLTITNMCSVHVGSFTSIEEYHSKRLN